MDCMERGSHARVVYSTQNTSRIRAARVKQDEKTDKNIIEKDYEKWNVDAKEKNLKNA